MFTRSAMAFGVLASLELLVFLLAVGRFGVLLLLAVVAAASVFGTVFLFRQMVGMVRQPVAPICSPFPSAGLFGGLLLPDLATVRSRRDVVDVYSTRRTHQGLGTNPPAAPSELH